MSVTNIPETVKLRLWGKSAGRCEYEGCNQRLWLDSLTQAEFNTAYIAHIVADKPEGPRGNILLSHKLATDISNLMVMCDVHHRLIDRGDVAGHPIERLQQMKLTHERRIDVLADIKADKQSHVLLYGANVGAQTSPLSASEAALAMVPNHYPASFHPLVINIRNSSFEDNTPLFWELENVHLENAFRTQVASQIANGSIHRLSVFALAPQPLLIRLGSLLSDIPTTDVYQLHREPRTWKWEEEPKSYAFLIEQPSKSMGDAALVFSLSATITNERIISVIGRDVPIWKITVAEPHNDFLKSKEQAAQFRQQMRQVLNLIKAIHGEDAKIHVFPAMPVALAVEFGRIWMPKADLPLIIYDENKRLGGFFHAISIGVQPKK